MSFTVAQGGSLHFLTRDRCVCTASEYPAAVNAFDAHKSVGKLVKIKKGEEADDVSEFGRQLMERGHEMEKQAKQWLLQNCRNWLLVETGFHFYREDPRFGASPDGFLLDMRDSKRYCLEIKSRSKMSGPVGDMPPMKHVIQVMGELAAVKLSRAILLYYSPDIMPQPKAFLVRFNEDFWGEIYGHLRVFASYMSGAPCPARNPRTFTDVTRISEFVTPFNINNLIY